MFIEQHTPSQWANSSADNGTATQSSERELHSGLDKTMQGLMCLAANELLLFSLGDGMDDVGSTGHCGVLTGVAQVSQCGSLPERVSLCFSACLKALMNGFVKHLFS